ncbi:Uncharacterized protein TCAP_03121, partial [Tolypocladium capitatum]
LAHLDDTRDSPSPPVLGAQPTAVVFAFTFAFRLRLHATAANRSRDGTGDMAGGRIVCYMDIASLFSYVAFMRLMADLDKLAANGVEVDIRPVFLGAIMQASGNRPPWTLAAKARYLARDARRAMSAAGVGTPWASPPNLMELSRTASPLRALHFVKANWPAATFHAALRALLRRFWAPPHASLAVDANLVAALADARDPRGRTLFSDDDVRRIVDARESMRDVLAAETRAALDRGAFGAPWFWVTNSQGDAEPFFGSDRFGPMYKHLDIAYRDVEVLLPGPESASKL